MEPAGRKTRIVIALVAAVVALGMMGNFFWPILKDFLQPRPGGIQASKVPLLMFGGFFLVMILAVLFSVVRTVRRPPDSPATAANRAADSKPWLARPDWAAGKIKSSANAQAKAFAIMALAFCGMGGLFTFVVLPKELHNGNYLALLILLFPAIGIGLLVAVIRGIQARRRYGDCFFEMASIPGTLGGSLDGMIQTGTRLRLEHGLHLKLSCLRRTVSGSGDDRSTHENVLWQDEKVFKSEAGLPEPEPGRSGIPVFFKIPANQPECFAHGNEAIVWRLEAKAKMSGPDFSATFDVPVFKVAGAVVAEADEPDPTAALQMPVEELRRDEHSKILVTDGPGGREFYFPEARNLGIALMLTIFLAIWSGFLWMMICFHAPLLFPIVFGLFEVLIFYGCLAAWFKSSRITVNSTGVTAANRWLIFSRTRRFDASDVVRFDTKAGMTSGSQVFTTSSWSRTRARMVLWPAKPAMSKPASVPR